MQSGSILFGAFDLKAAPESKWKGVGKKGRSGGRESARSDAATLPAQAGDVERWKLKSGIWE